MAVARIVRSYFKGLEEHASVTVVDVLGIYRGVLLGIPAFSNWIEPV